MLMMLDTGQWRGVLLPLLGRPAVLAEIQKAATALGRTHAWGVFRARPIHAEVVLSKMFTARCLWSISE